MSSVRLRNSLPLCDRHFRPMRLVDVVVSVPGLGGGVRTAFACGEDSCSRQYDIDYGYYTVSGGQFESGTTTRVACPNCERAMQLDRVEANGVVQEWFCPTFGCGGSKRNPGPMQLQS
jgi:hypothetical protein